MSDRLQPNDSESWKVKRGVWLPSTFGSEDQASTAGVDVYSKVLAFTAASAYALGLLIVNAYLLPLGVSDFDLVQARFVTTGLLVMSIIAVTWGGLVFAGLITFSWVLGQDAPLWARALGAANVAMALLIPPGLFMLLGQSWEAALELYFVSGFLGLMLLLFYFMAKSETGSLQLPGRWLARMARRKARKAVSPIQGSRRQSAWTPGHKAIGLIALSVFIIPYSFFLIALLAANVYPNVPEQLGGGKPKIARLVVSAPAEDALREAGLPLPRSGATTTPLNLVFEGSDFYVVETQGSVTHRFVISKDDVTAVRLG